jgi:hypothetical protein
VVADQGVELVLDDVLDPGTLGAVVGLGPQVGLSVRGTSDLQGDEVVLLVVTGGGITLVGVTGGELLLLELGRDRGVWPDRCGPSRHADRLTNVGLGDRGVYCARCPGRVRQDGA